MTAGIRWIFGGLMIALAAAGIWMAAASRSYAQSCGTDYILKQGETLADIARAAYGSASHWTVIYYANQDRLGENATLLIPGLAIKIPCIGQQAKPTPPPAASAPPADAPPAQARFQLSSMLKRIEFLTAEGYPPFTGRALPEGGLLIDVLQSSMNLIKDQAKGGFDYRVSWVNDWAAHLNPLLITRALDAGIPWSKPDCGNIAALDNASRYKCEKFFFSDPLYESLTVLYVRNDSAFNFERDEQIIGKSLCRINGWSTNDLDKDGRNWLKNGQVTLMQPPTVEECFRLLDQGTVDAIITSELTGQAVASAMGMGDRVHAVNRPLNIETLHVIVAKTHPHARTVLYYVNTSLQRLRDSGSYDAIVTKHLELFWNSVSGNQPAPMRADQKSERPPAPGPKEAKGKSGG
jgi:polar amino acid transport system substrate-binding protein